MTDRVVAQDVFKMEWIDGAVQITSLPPLPEARTQLSGGLVGDVVYIAGGIAELDATTASDSFWSLNLADESPTWIQQPALPSPRMQSVGGAFGDSFFCSVEFISARRPKVIPSASSLISTMPGHSIQHLELGSNDPTCLPCCRVAVARVCRRSNSPAVAGWSRWFVSASRSTDASRFSGASSGFITQSPTVGRKPIHAG